MAFEPYDFGGEHGSEDVESAEDVYGIDLGNDPNFSGYMASAGKGTTLNTALNAGLYAALGLNPAEALTGVGRGFTGGLAKGGFSPLGPMMNSLTGIQTNLGKGLSDVFGKGAKFSSLFLPPPLNLFVPFLSAPIGSGLGKGVESLLLALGWHPGFGNPETGFEDTRGAYSEMLGDLFGHPGFGKGTMDSFYADPDPSPYLGEDAFTEAPWADPGDPGDVGPTPGHGLPGNY